MATAEKGLMVLELFWRKESPVMHAREEGINSILVALPDIEWFRNYKFPQKSPTLGDIKDDGNGHPFRPPAMWCRQSAVTMNVRVVRICIRRRDILETIK